MAQSKSDFAGSFWIERRHEWTHMLFGPIQRIAFHYEIAVHLLWAREATDLSKPLRDWTSYKDTVRLATYLGQPFVNESRRVIWFTLFGPIASGLILFGDKPTGPKAKVLTIGQFITW